MPNSPLAPLPPPLRTPAEAVFYAASRRVLTLLAREVIASLNAAGVPYWADYGTLLGLIRDGGIIHRDTDVDLAAVEHPDTLARIDAIAATRHRAFTLARDGHRRSYEARFHLLPARCDLYIYRPDPANARFRGCEGPYSDLPAHLVGPTRTFDWHGLPVQIPADPEAFLAFRYGDNWRTPRHGDLGRLNSTYRPQSPLEARLRTTDIGW